MFQYKTLLFCPFNNCIDWSIDRKLICNCFDHQLFVIFKQKCLTLAVSSLSNVRIELMDNLIFICTVFVLIKNAYVNYFFVSNLSPPERKNEYIRGSKAVIDFNQQNLTSQGSSMKHWWCRVTVAKTAKWMRYLSVHMTNLLLCCYCL